jgi:hypothetical protein
MLSAQVTPKMPTTMTLLQTQLIVKLAKKVLRLTLTPHPFLLRRLLTVLLTS